MKEQTGDTPRPRGVAERVLLPAMLGAALLMFLPDDSVNLRAQEEQSPEQAKAERKRINRDRLNLLAQTQRRAAANADSPAANPAADAAASPAPPNAPIPPPNIPAAAPATPPAPNTAAPPAPDANATTNAPAPAAPADPNAPAPAAPANPNAPAPTAPADPNADPAAAPVAPTPAQGGGRPGFEPGFAPPGTGAGPNTGAGAPVGPGGTVSLQFPLNPVSDILNIYERLIQKTIIKDTTVFDGPQISLVTPEDVPRDEAIRLIEATLQVNGYVVVAQPEQKSVKILFGGERQGAPSPSFSEDVVIYTSEQTLPSGESLVGYFMELTYIDSETAGTIFGNHVVLNEFGRITPVTSPSGLLITESSSIVRQLIKLRQIIDVPAEDAPLMTEFVKLDFAEANVVAQIIQAVMDARREEAERQGESGRTISGKSSKDSKDTNSSNQSRSSQPQPQRTTQTFVRTADGRVVAQSGSGGSDIGIGTANSPAAQLIPDDRLGRIMVVASPNEVAYIIDLIKEFDQPLDTPDPVVRPLDHVKANDILPTIVDVLQDTGTGQTQLPGGRQIDSRATPVTSSQLTSLTGVQTGQQNQQNRNVQQGAADTEIGGRADQIAFPIDEVAPISVLVGKTRIIADRQSNTIIVLGTEENQSIVLNTIELLDKRPSQVYLATVIGELTLTDDFEFGVDYLGKFLQFSGDNPNDGGVTAGLITGRSDIIDQNDNTLGNIADLRDNIITTPFGPASGLNMYGQIGESLDVVITALQSNTNFRVISRPVVYTQNGKRAEITSGQEVPVPQNTITDTTNPNSVNTSIDYKEVVLKLEVLPTINRDREVTLEIVQINDRVVGEQLVAQNLIPIIGKQELNTTVTVPSRSTIVLGGLISESNQETDEGLPFLKDIPLLGRAFKTTGDNKTRTELMIFIQPIVVENDDETAFASFDEDARTEIGEDATKIFPEPIVPTEDFMQREADTEEYEKKGFFGRIGQRLFGPKRKEIIEPSPVADEIEIEYLGPGPGVNPPGPVAP